MLEFPGPVQFCFISLYLQILYLSILKRRIQSNLISKDLETQNSINAASEDHADDNKLHR